MTGNLGVSCHEGLSGQPRFQEYREAQEGQLEPAEEVAGLSSNNVHFRRPRTERLVLKKILRLL